MSGNAAFRRVTSNALALALGGVLAQLAFVTLEAVIARQLGVRAYGTFSSVYAYTLIMVHMLDLGLNWQTLQEGSRDRATLSGNLGTILVIKLLAFLLAYPAMLAILVWSKASDEAELMFAVFAFFGLAMMIQDAFATLFAALERMSVNAAFQAAVPVVMLLSVLVIVLPHPSLMRTAVACVLGTALVTLVWCFVTVRTLRPRVALLGVPRMLRQCYHYGITVSLNAVYFRLGVLLLSVLRSPAEVGLFAAAYKLLELGFKIPTLAIRVVAPKLFADSKDAPLKFRWEVDLLMRLTVAGACLMAMFIVAAGPAIVRAVFGSGFEAAGPLAQLIGLALAFKSIALVAQTVLSTADEHAYRTRADVVTIAVGILLAVPLILALGALGAAIAVVAADFVWAGLMVWRLRTHLPGSRLTALVLSPALGVVVSAGLTLFANGGVVVESVLGVLVLSAVLALSGYLRPLIAAVAELRAHRN